MGTKSNKHALVVDDDKDVRESLALLLDGMGLEAHMAGNGMEALEVLHGLRQLPCLILLDLLMPVMNGEEFLKHQNADPKLANIPVVLVSANDRLLNKAASLNVADALRKPISFSALGAVIGRYCSREE